MEWINIHTSQLRAPEYMGSRPAERSAWFQVLAYCVDQENSGVIIGAASWGDRQWQQTCGVTKREVMSAVKLLTTTDAGDIIVWRYPVEKEAEVKAKRAAGRAGGIKSGEARGEPKPKQTGSTASSKTEAQLEADAQAQLERKGKGKDNEKGIGIGIILAPTGVVAEGKADNPGPPAKKERPRDLIFEALAKIDNVVICDLTDSGRGVLNKARSAIVKATPSVTPEEIERREAILRRMYPNATMSASALAKHWARCAAPPVDSASYAAAEKRRQEAELKAEADAKAQREAEIAANPLFADVTPEWAKTVTPL